MRHTYQIGIDTGTTNGYIAIANLTNRTLISTHKLFQSKGGALCVLTLQSLLQGLIEPLTAKGEVVISIERPTPARIVAGKRIANNPLAFTQFVQICTILELNGYEMRVLEPKEWQKRYLYGKVNSYKARKEALYQAALTIYPQQQSLIKKGSADAVLIANYI